MSLTSLLVLPPLHSTIITRTKKVQGWLQAAFLTHYFFAGRGLGLRGRGAFASRGGARGRGRGRGAGHSTLTREQLDNQLDDYMSKTKGHLDAELDAYMAQADDME